MGGMQYSRERAAAGGSSEKRFCRESAVVVHRVFDICGIRPGHVDAAVRKYQLLWKRRFQGPLSLARPCTVPSDPPARSCAPPPPPPPAGELPANTALCTIVKSAGRMSRQLVGVNGLFTAVRACERGKKKLSTFPQGALTSRGASETPEYAGRGPAGRASPRPLPRVAGRRRGILTVSCGAPGRGAERALPSADAQNLTTPEGWRRPSGRCWVMPAKGELSWRSHRPHSPSPTPPPTRGECLREQARGSPPARESVRRRPRPLGRTTAIAEMAIAARALLRRSALFKPFVRCLRAAR